MGIFYFTLHGKIVKKNLNFRFGCRVLSWHAMFFGFFISYQVSLENKKVIALFSDRSKFANCSFDEENGLGDKR